MWDFETEASYQADLDWADALVRDEIEPLEWIITDPYDLGDPVRNATIRPLQQQVRARGLWATHLGPELGGQGHGQVKLALLNEILGRSNIAPLVFGCGAPDTGNAEILAHFGTPELKERYLQPLLDGELFSCFSMTEPQGGADPTQFTTSAVLDGDEWVINGEKWFSSNLERASFLIVMVVTDPDNKPHQRQSMFIVPREAPGIELVRGVHVYGASSQRGGHAYVRYNDVRVPADHLLGPRGGAFVVSQVRLGGGRIHHAMRTVGVARKALDMTLERALSRHTQGELLARKQLVQEMIADSWVELEQFRLLVLRTAWKIDRTHDYQACRGDIAAVKIALPNVLRNIAGRALQVHGALGVSDEMPFMNMITSAYSLGIADGPTEVHKVTLARQVLKDATAAPDLFPSQHRLRLRDAALAKYHSLLAEHGRA